MDNGVHLGRQQISPSRMGRYAHSGKGYMSIWATGQKSSLFPGNTRRPFTSYPRALGDTGALNSEAAEPPCDGSTVWTGFSLTGADGSPLRYTGPVQVPVILWFRTSATSILNVNHPSPPGAFSTVTEPEYAHAKRSCPGLFMPTMFTSVPNHGFSSSKP